MLYASILQSVIAVVSYARILPWVTVAILYARIIQKVIVAILHASISTMGVSGRVVCSQCIYEHCLLVGLTCMFPDIAYW